MDQESGVEMELEENMALLEWLANNYKSFGAALEIITGLYPFITFVWCSSFVIQIGVKREASL